MLDVSRKEQLKLSQAVEGELFKAAFKEQQK